MTRDQRSLIQRLRVPLGFVVVALYLLLSNPTWRLMMIGFPIAVSGALIRGWASGHIRKNAELAISGPYAHTRNPLYFGSFLMTIGLAISSGVLWLAVSLITLFLLIYYSVMKSEAVHMQRLFSRDYANWAEQVPLFIPRLTPYRTGDPRQFEIGLYLKHREYRASLGVLALFVVIAFKAGRSL